MIFNYHFEYHKNIHHEKINIEKNSYNRNCTNISGNWFRTLLYNKSNNIKTNTMKKYFKISSGKWVQCKFDNTLKQIDLFNDDLEYMGIGLF